MKHLLIYSSTSKKLLNLYKNYISLNLNQLFIKYSIISVPQKKRKKTFLKSPHVNKRSKENFILNVYRFKLHIFFNLTYLKVLRYNVPKNIHLKMLHEF